MLFPYQYIQILTPHFCISSCLCPNLLILQLVKLAKRLKKEKVNVDIINFGEEVRVILQSH